MLVIEQATLACAPLGAAVVQSLHGEEGMHWLPRWSLTVVSDDDNIALMKVVGAPAQLTLSDDHGGERQCALMVVEAAYAGRGKAGARYHLTLSSALWGLTLRRGYAIFRNQTAGSIVAELLKDGGHQQSLSLRLNERYQQRGYTAQYDESEWAFITRLLSDEAIASFIDDGDGDDGQAPKLVLTDHGGGHGYIVGERMRLSDTAGMNAAADCLFGLERHHRRVPTAALLRGYDVMQPGAPVEAAAGEGYHQVYEYAPRLADEEAASVRVNARLKQYQRDAIVAVAKTHCVRMAPGKLLRIEGARDEAFNGPHLIVGVRHALTQAAPDNSTDAAPYVATVTMVPFDGAHTYPPPAPPASTVASRPAASSAAASLLLAMPRIGGIETAQVTGPGSEEVHVDGLGRIKVRMAFDRSDRHDGRSSDWVRTMQWNLGGAMMLPRVGAEVPLVYEEGRPDAPIALGRLYHGASPLPYALPANKARSALQSATSPRDGSCNELRFNDAAGSQEMMLHASRDHTVAVGGDLTVEVSANQTIDAATARKLSIAGSQSATIGGDQTVTVAASMGTNVAGSRSVTVGGGEHIGADLSRIEAVSGDYTETIAAVASTRCNTAITSVSGAMTHMIGAACAITAGCGVQELVGGARNETTAGAIHIRCGKADEDAVGLHQTTAAAASFKAGGAVVLRAKAAAKIEAATSRFTAAGTLLIEAPAISITAATASLGHGAALKLSGSHAAKAKVTVKAPIIKHVGGTKARS